MAAESSGGLMAVDPSALRHMTLSDLYTRWRVLQLRQEIMFLEIPDEDACETQLDPLREERDALEDEIGERRPVSIDDVRIITNYLAELLPRLCATRRDIQLLKSCGDFLATMKPPEQRNGQPPLTQKECQP